MSLPRYPKYKDSEVQWLGRVPEHWGVGRLKNLLAQRITDGPHTTPTFVDEGVPFLSVDAIQDGELRFEGCRYVSDTDHGEFRKKALPRRGDLLMGKAASTGKLAQVKVDFEFSIWSPLALIRLSPSTASPSFFEQWLKSPVAQAQIDNLCTANTQKNISMDDIPRLTVTLPPLQEQIQITAFLDYETSKIDALVAEQERLIELLKEKRQAVISHAVTKGLNPDVPMKHSGIEWLGDVPQHWEELPLKAILALKHGYAFDGQDFSDSGEYVLMTPGNFNETGGFRFKASEKFYVGTDIPEEFVLQSGQLLVAMTEQAPGLLGSALFVPQGPSYLHNQRLGLVHRLRRDRVSERYLFHIFNSSRIRAEISVSSTGAKVKHTSPDRILSIHVFLPPLPEQEQIADFLDKRTATLDAMGAAAEQAIELLQERRTALISAAVTGQIDVREAAGRAA